MLLHKKKKKGSSTLKPDPGGWRGQGDILTEFKHNHRRKGGRNREERPQPNAILAGAMGVTEQRGHANLNRIKKKKEEAMNSSGAAYGLGRGQKHGKSCTKTCEPERGKRMIHSNMLTGEKTQEKTPDGQRRRGKVDPGRGGEKR